MESLVPFVSGFFLGTIFVPYWPLFIKLIKQTYLYASGNNRQAGFGQNPHYVRPGPPHQAQNPPPDFRKL